MQTTTQIGSAVEVQSIYVNPDERFIVSLTAGYGNDIDGIETLEQASAAALALIYGSQSDRTVWTVQDRQTGKVHYIDQADFEDLMHTKGYLQ